MLSEQAGIAGALGAHMAASAGMAGAGQPGRGASEAGGGGALSDQYAAEMAQAAPQLRALRIDSEVAPAPAAGGQTGVGVRTSPPDMQVCVFVASAHPLWCREECGEPASRMMFPLSRRAIDVTRALYMNSSNSVSEDVAADGMHGP